MKRTHLVVASIVVLTACCGQTGLGQEKLPAQPQVSKAEDQDNLPFVLVPETDGHWKRVEYYIERNPQADYRQASESAREAFRDLKYGLRIHWGVYALRNFGGEASWPLVRSMNFEQKQAYQQLYRKFNPKDFNAEAWMQMFKRNGLKMFAFTTKHHDGFSMYDTRTRVKQRVNWTAPGGPRLESCDVAYSIMETPFRRDIVKELCDAARQYDIKIDLYFSHPDWYDADFRPYIWHPVPTPDAQTHSAEFGKGVMGGPDGALAGGPHWLGPDKTAEETERMLRRHREQLTELLTRYGKIDMVCLDMWMGPNVWPQMREDLKILRRIQPDVMFRARGIGNYGDYYTPEGFVPGAKENTRMPWMVIHPLGGGFSYVMNDRYRGGDWIVSNLVDAVAKGGNFMPAIGPDANGLFDPKAIEALEYAGTWLKVNGQAIYATRPRDGDVWKEGNDVRFTRSKDNKNVYAICLKWPGKTLTLKSVRPAEGAAITMLGVAEPLKWKHASGAGLQIEIPDPLQDEKSRPCQCAWALRITPVQP